MTEKCKMQIKDATPLPFSFYDPDKQENIFSLSTNSITGAEEIRRRPGKNYEYFLGKFDYVLTNPPFNVDDVNLTRVKSDKRLIENQIIGKLVDILPII